MGRTRNRMYNKPVPSKKPKRKFLIIAEGEREDLYFGYFEKRSAEYDVSVELVPREEGCSAPKHVKDRLSQYEKNENWLPQYDDQLWFVFDVDKWDGQLHDLKEECETAKGWNIAISNPCFEVWLHYHCPGILAVMQTCDDFKRELPNCELGQFKVDVYAPLIKNALINSKEADTHPEQLFPGPMQTKVYKLADSLLALIEI